MKPVVVFMMGTTATGKTDAAAAFSDSFSAEIISVDSSLVYRGMNIGTAKPSAEFLNRYPHHLVDVCDPNDSFSVADFYDRAFPLINEIVARGKTPVLVGGTHFYFSALEQGMSVLPKANPALRDEIAARAEHEGWPKLHAQLAALDPESAQRIDSMDAQRIQRALEIVLESGSSVASHNANRKPGLPFQLVKLALAYSDRTYLHERIEQRFDQMLELGLQQEVIDLLDAGVEPTASSMRMIGYRQMLAHVHEDLNFDQMRLQGIAATRQLAKRQLTWLRNQRNILWWVDFGLRDRKFSPLNDFLSKFLSNL